MSYSSQLMYGSYRAPSGQRAGGYAQPDYQQQLTQQVIAQEQRRRQMESDMARQRQQMELQKHHADMQDQKRANSVFGRSERASAARKQRQHDLRKMELANRPAMAAADAIRNMGGMAGGEGGFPDVELQDRSGNTFGGSFLRKGLLG